MKQTFECCSRDTIQFQNFSTLSSFLKLASEENRLRILYILKDGEHCVCEIMEHINASQSLISHQLKNLKEANIILDKKRGLNVYYSLTKKGKSITDLIFSFNKKVNV